MENKYKIDSSSSFIADLFGSKQSTQPSSSTGFFASIFPPPKVVGRNSSCLELPEHMQKQSSGNHHAWSTKEGTTDVIKKTEGESNSMPHKERKIFQERAEPCPLSSSLYYGGQEDMYIHSSSNPSSDSFPIFKKDEVEGDPNGSYLHSASRGNWWQGSLYY